MTLKKNSPRPSTLRAAMKGKKFPQKKGKIQDIRVSGRFREVSMSDGSVFRVSKTTLKKAFYNQLNSEERRKALQGITPQQTEKGPRFVAKIGGQKKGKQRSYKTLAGAVKAVHRYYDSKK